MGDAERPSLAEAMDRPGAGENAERAVELAPLDALAQPGDRGGGGIGESEQEMGGIAAVAGVLVQRSQALGIVRPAIAQAGAEHLLQLGKTGEAQRLGEAHQGRGLHFRAAGERGGGAERDFVRVFERVSRGLAETLGQVRLDLDQAALEVVEALRRFGRRDSARHSPSRPTRRPRPPALFWLRASTSIEHIFQSAPRVEYLY